MNTDPGINNEESDGGEDVMALRMEVNALRDELRAALDAIEMARDVAPHAEDEDFGNFPMILPDPIPVSSFGFKDISAATIKLYGGTIRWAGRGKKTFPDDCGIEISGGSSVEPGYVSLRIRTDTIDMSDCEIVFTTTYPEDNGSYFFEVLHSAYLDGESGKWVRNLRDDIALRSPI